MTEVALRTTIGVCGACHTQAASCKKGCPRGHGSERHPPTLAGVQAKWLRQGIRQQKASVHQVCLGRAKRAVDSRACDGARSWFNKGASQRKGLLWCGGACSNGEAPHCARAHAQTLWANTNISPRTRTCTRAVGQQKKNRPAERLRFPAPCFQKHSAAQLTPYASKDIQSCRLLLVAGMVCMGAHPSG